MLTETSPDPTSDADAAAPLVLIVERDARLYVFLDRALSAAGYRVARATDGLRALSAFQSLRPDLVLVDQTLPVLDGLELARRLRAHGSMPIVMLATDPSVDDRVAALDAGADDCLARPFAIEELLARLRALRRGRALAVASAIADTRHGTLSYADVHLDQDSHAAWRGTRKLELRNRALELLACFLRHPERVLSRNELLEEAWGYEYLGDSNVVDVTIGHLRQALEAGGEPRLIHTVRPVGYLLRVERDQRPSQPSEPTPPRA
jgi:two-component system, OmpR family, response regulator MprA